MGLAQVKPALLVDRLVAGYGNMEVLHGIDLCVAVGQSICIVGPNGSGKSTVLRAIYGLANIRSGRIIANDRDITQMRPSKRLQQSGIAYVQQESSVFPDMTVEQNLLLGGFLMPTYADAAGAAEAVMDRYPILAKQRRQPASALSGGERRLLEIARAMMMDPETLLLDEPSIGLSPRFVDEVFDLFRHLQQDLRKSLVIVEQNARKALEFADIGYVLTAGNVVVVGKGKELLDYPKLGRLFLGGAPERAGSALSV